MRTMFAPALFVVLGLGQVTCPEQAYLPIPSTLDAAKIVVNPSSTPAGQKLYLGTFTVSLGQTVRHIGHVGDPTDPIEVSTAKGTITLRTDGTYLFEYTPTAVGTEYINFTARDVRPTNDSKTTMGTVAVVTVPANLPPVFY